MLFLVFNSLKEIINKYMEETIQITDRGSEIIRKVLDAISI